MKRIYLLLLLVSTLTFAQIEEVEVYSDSVKLSGTLTIPKTKEKLPVFLLIAGSGPTDRNGNQKGFNSNMFKHLAESLQGKKIATFRYDKRGVGKSSQVRGLAKENSLVFDDYIKDVKACINYLDSTQRFSNIIVCGHSEGSLIGMIASLKNPKVSAYVSLAGPGRPIGDVLKEQLTTLPDSLYKISTNIIDSLQSGLWVKNVPPQLMSLFRPSIQPYMISWMKYDPRKIVATLKKPTLVIQGDNDIQVKVEDAQNLKKAKPESTLLIVNDVNHVLKDCDIKDRFKHIMSYNSPKEPINKKIIKALVRFTKKNASK